MITLYQFQFSHYCEKVRWALDFKGLPYARRNLLPGLHVKIAKKLVPKSCLPIIVDGGTVVQDSSAIITYLDERFPERPLTPRDSKQASNGGFGVGGIFRCGDRGSAEALVLLPHAPGSRACLAILA